MRRSWNLFIDNISLQSKLLYGFMGFSTQEFKSFTNQLQPFKITGLLYFGVIISIFYIYNIKKSIKPKYIELLMNYKLQNISSL